MSSIKLKDNNEIISRYLKKKGHTYKGPFEFNSLTVVIKCDIVLPKQYIRYQSLPKGFQSQIISVKLDFKLVDVLY
jgi:hypothetical protein